MATKTISQLTAATTPLAGTEELPIVQGGVTVKASANSIADLFVESLIIDADGSIGNTDNISYTIRPSFPSIINGPTIISSKAICNFGLSSYGQFTATYINISGPSVFYTMGIQNFPNLTSISCTAQRIIDNIALSDNPNVTSINFPNLNSVKDLSIGGYNSSVTFNFSSLVTVSGTITFSGNSGVGSTVNNSLFPLLTRAGIAVVDTSSISSVNLPSLNYLNYYYSAKNVAVNLPNIIECTSSDISLYYSISSGTFIIGTVGITKKWANSPNLYLSDANLNVTSVNNTLTVLASLNGTNGTTSCNNGTLVIAGGCAAPTGAGITAKTVLEGRGWTVYTN